MRVPRRIEGHGQQRQAGRLPDRGAELVDLWRQIGLGLGQPVLDVDLIGVDVGIGVERDGQLRRVVVGIRRLHVQHVVDAVHLLFDRAGDRLLHGDGVGARIRRRDDDLGRYDFRELCLRKPAHGDDADDHGDDGDDHRNDRPVDEESGHAISARSE